MTINRLCKDVCGLSGNTWNPGAAGSWTRVHHHIVALLERLNKEIKKKTKERYTELGTARIKWNEEDARNVIICNMHQCMDSWTMRKDYPITMFATGEIATDGIKDDIIDLKKRR